MKNFLKPLCYCVFLSLILTFGLIAPIQATTPVNIVPQDVLEEVTAELQEMVNCNPMTKLSDKVEDVVAKCQTALFELKKLPPDNQAAVGNIEGAIGDIEAAVKEDLFTTIEYGIDQMDKLTGVALKIALDAIHPCHT